MGQLEIERLQAGMEAYTRGDMDAALEHVADDFVLIDHVLPEDTTEWTGPRALAEQLERAREAFDDLRYEPVAIIERPGSRYLVELAIHARGNHTSIELDFTVWQVWTTRDGLATRAEIFSTREAAEAALALG